MCSEPETADFLKQILLSHDSIIEILSFLPVKSLLRFKCVCKSWCADIQESYFIMKHGIRGKYYWKYDSKEFKCLDSMNGLVLEKSNLSHKYRIRNPMTRQVLDLPDPLEKFLAIRIFHVPTSENYKLIYVYKTQSFAGCRVLTVGTDLEWRHLDVPNLLNIKLCGTADMIFLLRYGASEICCVEVGSECMFKVKVPETFTSSGWQEDVVFPRPWELSKCFLAKIEQKNLLHVWVLEDYRNQKWVEKKIVLEFMNVYPDTTTKFIVTVHANRLFVFLDENLDHLLSYHLESKNVRICAHFGRAPSLNYVRASLVHLKGMQTDSGRAEDELLTF